MVYKKNEEKRMQHRRTQTDCSEMPTKSAGPVLELTSDGVRKSLAVLKSRPQVEIPAARPVTCQQKTQARLTSEASKWAWQPFDPSC